MASAFVASANRHSETSARLFLEIRSGRSRRRNTEVAAQTICGHHIFRLAAVQARVLDGVSIHGFSLCLQVNPTSLSSIYAKDPLAPAVIYLQSFFGVAGLSLATQLF
ncbi:hypothetical protein AFLA_001302 [Aspergillus flavus NRRL3357]|nr:hypothetical protein AFLA_001302 [Aspergillus flavus NRRL3357]